MADLSTGGLLISTGIAVAASIVTAYATARIKARHDLDSWQRSREAMVSESAVALLRDTVTAISAAGHSACWLTWKALHDPDSVTAASIEHYDATMHDLFPRMLGGQAAIGAFCPESAGRIREAVRGITAEDAEIGLACIAFRAGDRAPLADRHTSAYAAYEEARKLCEGLGAHLLAGKKMR